MHFHEHGQPALKRIGYDFNMHHKDSHESAILLLLLSFLIFHRLGDSAASIATNDLQKQRDPCNTRYEGNVTLLSRRSVHSSWLKSKHIGAVATAGAGGLRA